MHTTTNLPTLQEFKQKAKTLKKNNDSINTLGEALNTLSKEYGYKNWNVMKTKLIDTSLMSNKGILLMDTDRNPVRSLEFILKKDSLNNPVMEYHVTEDNIILHTAKSFNEAHQVFLSFDVNTGNQQKLKPFEVYYGEHTVTVNNVIIEEEIFVNEILPFRYSRTEDEINRLRYKIKTGDVTMSEFHTIDNKIKKLKLLSDKYIFSNILILDSFCSPNTNTLKFNMICQNVLDEHERLKNLKVN